MIKNLIKYLTLPLSLAGTLLASSPAKTDNPFKNITVSIENVLFQDYDVSTRDTLAYSLNRHGNINVRDSNNMFNLPNEEKLEVQEAFKLIQDDDFTYSNFINQLKGFSDDQKVFALGVLGGLFAENYDPGLNLRNISGEEFYSSLKTYLQTGQKTPTGICGSIHQELKNLADILGFDEAVNFDVTNKKNNGHVALALKNNDKWYVIDYKQIIEVNSKNFRKVIETKALAEGRTTLQSHVWDDDFKFELWTRDGQMFKDLIEYDTTTETTKDKLLYDEKNSDGLELRLGNYYSYAKASLPIRKKDSVFLKVGVIKGTEISPLKKGTVYQAGIIGNKGNEAKKGNFSYKVGVLYSKMNQDAGTENPIVISGDISYLKRILRNKNSVNLIVNASGAADVSAISGENNSFSEDPLITSLRVSAGTLFLHDLGDSEIGVYLIMQGMPALNNPSEQKLIFANSENNFGILYKNDKFSVNPEFIKRLEENVAALSFGFDKEKIKGKVRVEKGKSNFENFFPDKDSVSMDVLWQPKKIGLEGSIKYVDEDWDGESDKNLTAYFGIVF